MKKFNKEQPVLNSFEEVNDCLLNIAVMTLKADRKETKMNEELLKIKQKYETGIKELRDSVKTEEFKLEEFCKKNKKEFAETRSRALTYGTIGFRSGKNRLALLGKKFNWEFVKEKFQDLFATKYVEVKTKFSKSKVLADVEKGILTADQLAAAGCKLVRGESSFYKINYDSVNLVDEKE